MRLQNQALQMESRFSGADAEKNFAALNLVFRLASLGETDNFQTGLRKICSQSLIK